MIFRLAFLRLFALFALALGVAFTQTVAPASHAKPCTAAGMRVGGALVQTTHRPGLQNNDNTGTFVHCAFRLRTPAYRLFRALEAQQKITFFAAAANPGLTIALK